VDFDFHLPDDSCSLRLTVHRGKAEASFNIPFKGELLRGTFATLALEIAKLRGTAPNPPYRRPMVHSPGELIDLLVDARRLGKSLLKLADKEYLE
jgi:hypothetical protein